MKDLQKNLRVALVQATPVLFNKDATIAKVCGQIAEAGKNGAELIVFPESVIPCYPYGLTYGFTVGSRTEACRDDWKIYYDNAVLCPSADTDRIGRAAAEAHAYVSIGYTERDYDNGSLYCSNMIFAPTGELLCNHRKLKPTGAERLIWSDANRGYFPVADTPWGKMGSLICWENYMPLARAALYSKGVSLYLCPNTNNNAEWHDTIRHIAIEGKCFVFHVNQYFTKDMYPTGYHGSAAEEMERLPQAPCNGGSAVIDPYGHYVTEPVWNKECLIYADINPDEAIRARMEFDPCGHYARPDVTELILHEK
ncbi:MAG: carbon-nitrogen hydrolase family protein [Clostridiales bacterium]|nr:carbon-nitrogen hydrolase family protein [Clostridiales bacterium]